MKKISMLSRWGLGALGALAMAPAHAEWTLNMGRGVTDLTDDVFGLHMLIFWICVVIGIGVFGAMLYSVIMHRKARGFEAAHFHESTVVEIAWTVVPFIILIAVAIPAAGTLLQIEDSSDPDMTIRVTGYQWLWEYDYVDEDVSFFSRIDRESDRARQLGSGIDPASVEHYLRNVDNPMVVPVDTRVRLLLTSGDVIHSWWVPELGGKKDAIPGYINDMWFKANETGTYRGQCAELCGRGHAFMPIVVKVVSQSEYDDWVAEQGGDAESEGELATGQPSSGEVSADEATSSEESPTAGNATEGRTEDGREDQPEEAEESIVGSGEEDEGSEPATGDEPSSEDTGSGDGSSGASGGGSSEVSEDELMSEGETVYANLCAACHQPDGSGMPSAGFPALKDGAITTGPVEAHVAQVLNGKGAMPPYRGSLSDREIAAVVTYERNSFGNSTGDVIQPSQVAEQR
ncbi:cytochrome B559 subunit alpha [Salinisphaera orenii MK-B5]|uniref:Cytochrome c oxidase subunit 2 n=2 Tax=Salinisphaera TaxID=180541 RepID=A0A423PQC7_9GAMM|nr:cytochrome B559 subunit alpha [Salinisphaera orenii MK-B5]